MIRERKKRTLKILVKNCVIATLTTIDWSAESISGDTRFFIYLYIYRPSQCHSLKAACT